MGQKLFGFAGQERKSNSLFLAGAKNRGRLHPYFPFDVRLISVALLGLGAYLYVGTEEQHQPRVGDGRILGSPDSREPDPKLLPNGEPEPFDEEAVAKFEQRLERRTKHGQTQNDSQHQPNARDGRTLGSPDSQEPDPRLLPSGEPEPFDEAAVAKHEERLQQHQHQPRVGDGRKLGSPDSKEPQPETLSSDQSAVGKHEQRLAQRSQHADDGDSDHQPRVGDGRKLGSPDSKEPQPENLLGDSTTGNKSQQQSSGDDDSDSQHQPRVGDGRKLGSPDSKEPQPETLLSGSVAGNKSQRQSSGNGGGEQDSQHQPRVGDGRKLGSPDSQEPDSRLLPSGEPEPFDEEAVARHQQRLEQKVRATIVVVVPMTSICNTALGTCVLVQR